MVVLNFKVSCFVTRIREKFLDLDFDTLGQVCEASPTHSVEHRMDLSGCQNPLVNGLESNVNFDVSAGFDSDNSFSPLFSERDRQLVLAHLSGVVDDVSNINRERAWLLGLHNRQSYRAALGRGCVLVGRNASDVAGAGVEELRYCGRNERRHIATEPGHLAHQRTGHQRV